MSESPKLSNTSGSSVSANSNADVAELREQLHLVSQDVQELAKTAGNVAKSQLDPIEDYIREQPLKAALIAAGVGWLVGVFSRR